MSTYYYYGDTLYHHGIKGQKWGLRKYQNEDGSLTPAGREHYGYGQDRSLSGRIRDAQYRRASASANEASRNLKELRSIEKNARTNPNGINNSRISTAIRNRQIAKSEKQLREANDAKKELESIAKYKAEKRAEKEEYKNSDEYKARQEKIKKAAKIGLAVAGTALAAYGAYKLSEAIKDKNRIEAGKRAAMNLYNANAPATMYARQSKLDGKVYYKMKNAYGDTIQTGRAKDLDSYRKIVSDRQWEATQQHVKAIRDLRAKKRK